MVCLETSFLVDFLHGEEKAKVIMQDLQAGSEAITIAAPSIMEVISGAELEHTKKEKEKIFGLLSSITILSLDKYAAIMAGEIEAELIMAGETIPALDILIGAIAKSNNEILVTRNIRHFGKIKGLEIQAY